MTDAAISAATLESSEQPIPLEGAGFWIRAGGRVIDRIIHLALWFASLIGIVFAMGIFGTLGDVDPDPTMAKLEAAMTGWPVYVPAIVSYTMYHALMEWMSGSTIGKRVLGLIVVDARGRRVRFKAAFGRSLAYLLDAFVFGLVAKSRMAPPLQQRYGDAWWDTVVVRRTSLSPDRLAQWRGIGRSLAAAFVVELACVLALVLIYLHFT